MMSTFTCDMSPAYDYSSVPKKQPKPQDATHTTVSVYLAAGFATIFLKVFVILAHFTTNNLVQHPPKPTPLLKKKLLVNFVRLSILQRNNSQQLAPQKWQNISLKNFKKTVFFEILSSDLIFG